MFENEKDIIMCTGGMSIDPDDVTPSAIRESNWEIVTYGTPVLPGAMFMLAYKGEKVLIGLPGGVVFSEKTVFDVLLPRILANDRITKQEIIEMGHASIINFGAKQDMFTVRVNHRQLINRLMDGYLKLDIVGASMMTKLLDRKNKISAEEFKQQAVEIFGSQANEGLPKLAEMIGMKSVNDLPEELADDPSVKQIREVMDLLVKKGIKNAIFDITLMRGLDYYTGTVFEFFDNSPENNRALFGGGRYDGLVGLFGVEPIATVGVGLGATTMQQFLEVHGLLPQLSSHTDVYLIPVDKESLPGADTLAQKLRAEGVKAELDITGRKLDKQIKTAAKKQIPFAVFIGEDEIKNGMYTVKNLAESNEQKVDFDRMITIVKDRRYDSDDDDSLFEI